jgi:hypothetical protein
MLLAEDLCFNVLIRDLMAASQAVRGTAVLVPA